MKNYLDCRNNTEYEKLKEPARIIKNGGIVIFPTETVYGIGANGLNEEAIKKLYEVKQRPLNKPISLLVNSIEMVNKIAKDITELEYALMKEFFPGPLTIILNKKVLTSIYNLIGDFYIVPNTINEVFIIRVEETLWKDMDESEINSISRKIEKREIGSDEWMGGQAIKYSEWIKSLSENSI